MLSIGTITAGDGYQYLTKEVASGVEDYYMRGGTEPGEAHGWWLGAQREDFGVTDRLVTEQQMAGFFGAKCDPVTGERLGSRFRVYATVEERLARARDEYERWVAEDLATRSAALRAAGERPEREGESLAAHKEATPSDILQARSRSKRLKKRVSSQRDYGLRPSGCGTTPLYVATTGGASSVASGQFRGGCHHRRRDHPNGPEHGCNRTRTFRQAPAETGSGCHEGRGHRKTCMDRRCSSLQLPSGAGAREQRAEALPPAE